MSKLCLIIGVFFCAALWGPAAYAADGIPKDFESLPWSEARTLTALDAHAISPTIVADQEGLHVIYQELRMMSNATVSYVFSPDLGKTWTRRTVLSAAYSMGVGTSLISHRGVLHAVWCPTERGINGLNYRRSTNSGKNWEREKVLTKTERAIYLPKIYADDGTLYLAWVEKQVLGSDLATRAPTVKDLDIRTMTLKENRRPARIEETYDCTFNMMISRDGGDTWTPKLVIDRFFEDVSLYNFKVEGMTQIFNYRLQTGAYRRLATEDSGLVWKTTDITEEQFGAFEPPSVVQYRKNLFHIGIREIANRSVIYLVRTDYDSPQAIILNQEEAIQADAVTLRWEGQDDWSNTAKLKYRYRVGEGATSDWTEQTEISLSGLSDGMHRLSVEAMDEAGNVSAEPAAYEFEVKAPPETAILTQVPPILSERSPRVEWSGSDNTTLLEQMRFQSSLDGASWQDLGTDRSLVLPALKDGPHILAVRAVDEADNVDDSPAVVRFYVDTVSPETLKVAIGRWVPGIDRLAVQLAGRDDQTASERLLFSLQIDERDPGPFVRNPAIPLQGLDDGDHRLFVRVRDEAGNVEEPPREESFAIEIPPAIRIISAPLPAVPKADFEVFCRVSDNTTPPDKIRVTYRIGDEPWQEPLPGPVFRVIRKNLQAGRHRLQVKAIDERGNESPPGQSTVFEFFLDPGMPAPPRNFEAEIKSDGTIRLSWRLPAGVPKQGNQFTVYRSTSGGFGITPEERKGLILTSELASRSYTDYPKAATGATPARYLYAVSLTTSEGKESPLSRVELVEITPDGERTVMPLGPKGRVATAGLVFLLVVVSLVLLGVSVLVILVIIRRSRA